ncbi:MAG TPA: CAP domain-containing protein [Paenibacillaceae bacterium]
MRKTVMSVVSALVMSAVLFALPAAPAGAAAVYQVKSGDTMYLIAQRHGVTLNQLIRYNPHVVNPNVIRPGMWLIVPDKGVGQTGGSQTGKTGTAPSAGTGQTGSGAAAGMDSNASYFASEVVRLVNAERAKAGLAPLKVHNELTRVALHKAKDMYHNNYFSHQSPTYGSPFDMMRSYGISFRYAGENIAKGQRSPQEVMNAWMNSSGHRANILNGNFTHIGVAYYNGVWVQMFIG